MLIIALIIRTSILWPMSLCLMVSDNLISFSDPLEILFTKTFVYPASNPKHASSSSMNNFEVLPFIKTGSEVFDAPVTKQTISVYWKQLRPTSPKVGAAYFQSLSLWMTSLKVLRPPEMPPYYNWLCIANMLMKCSQFKRWYHRNMKKKSYLFNYICFNIDSILKFFLFLIL